jgi:hypothetical protein
LVEQGAADLRAFQVLVRSASWFPIGGPLLESLRGDEKWLEVVIRSLEADVATLSLGPPGS